MHLHNRIHAHQTQSLGEASATKPKPRSQSLHYRMPEKVVAACREGQHHRCRSLNCICECHRKGQ